jgi:hypothetical protein
VEGISDALQNVIYTNMPADAIVVLMEEVLLTSAGRADTKAVRDNTKCIAFY